MAPTETFGSDLSHCSSVLLILSSVITCLLAIAYISLCVLERSSLPFLMPFALCLILSCVQYSLAAMDINVAHLTVITDVITVLLNIMTFLFVLLEDCIDNSGTKVNVVQAITASLLLLFILASIATIPEAIYIDFSFTFPNSDYVGCTFIDVALIIWNVTLCIAIAANLWQVCLAFALRSFLDLREHPDKRAIHSLLFYLLLSSLLLALNNFGILFEVPLLNIIPYLLAQVIFIPIFISMICLWRQQEERQLQQLQQLIQQLLLQEEEPLPLLQLLQRQQQEGERRLLDLLKQRQERQQIQLQQQEEQLLQLLLQQQQEKQHRQQLLPLLQLLLQRQQQHHHHHQQQQQQQLQQEKEEQLLQLLEQQQKEEDELLQLLQRRRQQRQQQQKEKQLLQLLEQRLNKHSIVLFFMNKMFN
jgi:hypothetical protein